jgi:hypothetical protein
MRKFQLQGTMRWIPGWIQQNNPATSFSQKKFCIFVLLALEPVCANEIESTPSSLRAQEENELI